jgi:glycosyltransferase involved in cell wall biosynthesis
VIVGRGPRREVVEALVRELPEQTSWVERLEPGEVATALDRSTCLVLPSRSEGLGRVLLEAFLRGRPAVAMNVGGIRDAVVDGVNGLLADDDAGLEAALVRMLTDGELAARLGEGALEASRRWQSTPERYAQNLRELVDSTLASR